MKKLVLATTITAASIFSTGAHAIVSSAINSGAIEVYTLGNNVEVDCASLPNSGFTTGLALSGQGTGAGQINFVGTVCLDYGFPGGPYVAFDFNLRGEAVTTPNPGTTFNLGRIDIYADWTTGWSYYGSIDATTTPLDCLDTGATTAGLQWVGGVNTLPGTNNGTNAVCETTWPGIYAPVYIYLTGTNTN